MAIENTYLLGTNITLGCGFDLQAKGPLDSRATVPNYAGLQALIDGNAAYEGMIVYDEGSKETYQARIINNALKFVPFFVSQEEILQMIQSQTTQTIVFKGTIATLPEVENEASTRGYMYKASARFTIPSEKNAAGAQPATVVIGDAVIYEGEGKWWHVPSGDSDTWRPVKVKKDGTATTTTTIQDKKDITFIGGDNVEIVATENGDITINAKDTHHEAELVFGPDADNLNCADASTANGLYLKLGENNTVKNAHKITVANDTPMTITHSVEKQSLEFAIAANSATSNGYVAATQGVKNKVWKTDENGVPGWREDDNDNTEYTGEDKITVDGTKIKHDKLTTAAASTKEANKKSTFVTEVTVDEYGHTTGYKTAEVDIPDVSLDGKSIDRKNGAIELKGFADATKLTVPQKNAAGTGLDWVTIEGTDTKTVGDGKSIVAAATNATGANVTLQIKDVDEAEAGKILAADGEGGVEWVDDKDTVYDIGFAHTSEDNYAALELYENGGQEPKKSLHISGGHGIIISGDENSLEISTPEISFERSYSEEPSSDTIEVVSYLHTGEEQGVIVENVVDVPTKAYVDRLVSGATSYIGTVADEPQLDQASVSDSVNKGDFLRVTGTIEIYDRDEQGNPKKDEKGEFIVLVTYHPSDMLICETSPIFDDEGNCTTPATWSVIHGEIDANTWVANSKTADGYVTKGEGQVKKIWATDKDENPGWKVAYDTAATADTLAQRQDNGQLTVAETPVADTDAASKKYVDESHLIDSVSDDFVVSPEKELSINRVALKEFITGFPSKTLLYEGPCNFSDTHTITFQKGQEGYFDLFEDKAYVLEVDFEDGCTITRAGVQNRIHDSIYLRFFAAQNHWSEDEAGVFFYLLENDGITTSIWGGGSNSGIEEWIPAFGHGAATTARIYEVENLGIEPGAQVNTIECVEENTFSINENKQLQLKDHAISAHHTKACADYEGEDAEVWVFNCGGAADLI